MAYATVTDVEARLAQALSEEQQNICSALLDDAAVIIDVYNADAAADIKKIVSCDMVKRAIGDSNSVGVPVGASQGSMSAMGYSQSWTMTGGSTGELYLSKQEKKMLGLSNKIGSWTPVQELVPEESE